MEARTTIKLWIDGRETAVQDGATILEACDSAQAYVPRLCSFPGIDVLRTAPGRDRCGLCAVTLADGSHVLSCEVRARRGLEVTTSSPYLAALRLERLGRILAHHPHACLSCDDRDGCARDTCTRGVPVEQRCCQALGSCEIGRLVWFLDPLGRLGGAVSVGSREVDVEGPIRREAGLCIGCGRCVGVCCTVARGGNALELRAIDAWPAGLHVARPKGESLRASGCTFCGACVAVCPTGALMVSSKAPPGWRDRCRVRNHVSKAPIPPSPATETPQSLSAVPPRPGVYTLVDARGQVIAVKGVADLRAGLGPALDDCARNNRPVTFTFEEDALYTQRESELLSQYARELGYLPIGEGLEDDLF